MSNIACRSGVHTGAAAGTPPYSSCVQRPPSAPSFPLRQGAACDGSVTAPPRHRVTNTGKLSAAASAGWRGAAPRTAVTRVRARRCPRGRPDYECRQRCSEVTASVASCRAPGAEGSCDTYNIFTTVCLVFTIFTIFTISDCHNVAALDDDRPGLHQDTLHGRHPG